jgi:RimJ/RimL family protein N-acetyltransferase
MEDVTTPRLIVRRFAVTDLADFLAYHTHPEVAAVLPGEPKNEERAAQYLARQAVAQDNEKEFWHAFAVYHREDAKVIGEVGIYLGGPPENKGEIGFALHPDYHGCGYAMEAAQPLLQYAFVTCDLRRITAMCDTDNTSSYRLMERLRMTREGHFRQTHWTRGAWRDEYLYALLRDEWLVQQAS